MTTDKLKPCPFCGSKDIVDAGEVVICNDCLVEVEGGRGGSADDKWNRRAPAPAPTLIAPVDQTVFGYPNGNCYSACLASILGIPLESVPHFFEPSEGREQAGWNARVNKYLERFGLWRLVCKPIEFSDVPENAVTILAGPSPNFPDTTHAVVGRGLTIAHDPNPTRKGLEGTWKDWEVEFFIPLTPKPTREAEAPAPVPSATDRGRLADKTRAGDFLDTTEVSFHHTRRRQDIVNELAAEFAAVRQEETERCAKVCDEIYDGIKSLRSVEEISRECAAAIRGKP